MGRSGPGARTSALVFLVLFVHSLPEGFAVGTAFASDRAGLSLFVILAIAIQNIPEGTSVAIPMEEAGFSRTRQFWAAVGTSAPQPVGALIAFVAVEQVSGLLPFSFAFAAGAMLALIVAELLPQAYAGPRRAGRAAQASLLGAAADAGAQPRSSASESQSASTPNASDRGGDLDMHHCSRACSMAPVPVIETERLTKFYGSARGIEDVTIAVEAGEVFGFLGPNGAGKTTTIRTLLDLLHPTQRQRPHLRPRQPPRQRRDPRPARQPARRLRLRQAGHRARGGFAAGAPARESRASAAPRRWRALPRRPRPPARAALARQPPEGRPDPGRSSTRPSC